MFSRISVYNYKSYFLCLVLLLACTTELPFAKAQGVDTGERILLLLQSNTRGGDVVSTTPLAGGDSACDNMAMEIASAAARRNHTIEPMRCLDVAARPRFDVICTINYGQKTISYTPPGVASCKRQDIN